MTNVNHNLPLSIVHIKVLMRVLYFTWPVDSIFVIGQDRGGKQ